MKKLIMVAEEEKEMLIKLIERKNSLFELNEIANDKELKFKVNSDIERNQLSIYNWWSDVKQKYKLEDKKESCYYFDSSDGFLYNN